MITVWKVSKHGVFSGPYFSLLKYGDLQNKSPYLVRAKDNTDQKTLRIWTLFTQCIFSIWSVCLSLLLFVLSLSSDSKFCNWSYMYIEKNKAFEN